LIIGFFGVVGPAALSVATGDAPAPAKIEGRRFSDHIRILSSDAFEGRFPGTAGETKALAYITEQFENIGLQPAGDDGGWTQQVPLRRFATVGEIKSGFTFAGKPHPLTELQDIVVYTKSPTNHVTVKNAPLVFIGFGVSAPERHWDDFKGYDLKGKMAVVLINDPDFEIDPTNPLYGRFDGKSMTYYGRWTYKFEEAARRGAIGVLIVHETEPAGYGWNTVKNSDAAPHFDIVRPGAGVPHLKVEGWIQRKLAVDLFNAAGLDFDAEKRRAQSEDFMPVELQGARCSVDFAVNVSTIISHNVIGKLAGTRYPDEAVIYGAHWDHLGIGAPDSRGDRIYNGADDNASGVASILELSRVFASSARTARSVYFIGFTAEEEGLLGSEYYATHPVVPSSKTVAFLNIDGANLMGPARNISSRGSGKSTLDDLLAVEAEKGGREFTPDRHPEKGYFFRADNLSLAKVGVPGMTLAPGLNLVEGGFAAGEAWANDYIQHRYHQPSDEWQADWDLRGAEIDLTTYYNLGDDLANSRDWPAWKAGSEFSAIRDKSAAMRR
jgi:Zn-dependent M28 family amino/carboxypeptidase